VIELLVSAAFTVAICPVVRKVLVHRGIIDHANDRSSHVLPTPRGGGLACAVGVLAGWAAALVTGRAPSWPVLAAIIALAVLGLLDDHRDLPALVRLAAQIGVGAGLGAAVGDGSHAALALLLGATLVCTSVNVVNFMDGINGITGITMVVWGSSAALVGHLDKAPARLVLGSLTVGAAAGFLPFNLPAARLFLGDVGSYLFGALVATTLLLSVISGARLATLLAPLALYLTDAGVTLLRRARRGAPLLKAHREHTYQQLTSVVGLSHPLVAVGVGVISALVTLAWLIPAPWLSTGLTVTLLAGYLASPRWAARALAIPAARAAAP